jgi:lipopolysaccharide transport system ATP-binding protein
MGVVIKVENLSKQYRLGDVGTGSLKDDFKRFRHRLMGKEDPFLQVGEVNDRTKKSSSDYVWALKDINFEIEQGDVVGIIGRNGAGKSTLLKILSRTTAPTTGTVKVKGRIASLLEVGTGFHGELSGRENIYLNGAIMGLRKWEIDKKLDEIIDFAGVEKYLDTPVKRYSSGMYVRLAFAVAAHLEPDILIVDEVLAVGDAEFQKKCLGKMKDVSRAEGRTILFVSHQIDAISRLCSSALLLKDGELFYNGSVEKTIKLYHDKQSENNSSIEWALNKPGNNIVKLNGVRIVGEDERGSEKLDIDKSIKIIIEYEVLIAGEKLTSGINLFNQNGDYLFTSHDIKTARSQIKLDKGKYISAVIIPGNFLAEGIMNVSVSIMSYDPFTIHFHEKNILSFLVVDNLDGESARGIYAGEFPGLVRPMLEWETQKLKN